MNLLLKLMYLLKFLHDAFKADLESWGEKKSQTTEKFSWIHKSFAASVK